MQEVQANSKQNNGGKARRRTTALHSGMVADSGDNKLRRGASEHQEGEAHLLLGLCGLKALQGRRDELRPRAWRRAGEQSGGEQPFR